MKRVFLFATVVVLAFVTWVFNSHSECQATAIFDGNAMTLRVESAHPFNIIKLYDTSERVSNWTPDENIRLYAEFEQQFQLSTDKDAERVINDILHEHDLTEHVDYVVLPDNLTYASPSAVVWSNFGQNTEWRIGASQTHSAGALTLSRDNAVSEQGTVTLRYTYHQRPQFRVELMTRWSDPSGNYFGYPTCDLNQQVLE